MAKAARLPKLKWKPFADGEYVAGRVAVAKSVFRPGLWAAYRIGGPALGFGSTVAEAKAIAQAFADSETLRGEGG